MLSQMKRHAMRHQASSRQSGVALVEALVALLILALGVLGLARLQVSALTESRNTNARAVAVQLAADLSERMQSNADIRRTNPDPSPYETGWGEPAAAETNCLATACNSQDLAAFDLRAWKLNLQALLPGGDAQVFRSDTDPNQFGVLVGWQAFTAKNQGLTPEDVAQQASYTDANQVTDGTGAVGTGVANVRCNPGLICHLVYIRP